MSGWPGYLAEGVSGFFRGGECASGRLWLTLQYELDGRRVRESVQLNDGDQDRAIDLLRDRAVSRIKGE